MLNTALSGKSAEFAGWPRPPEALPSCSVVPPSWPLNRWIAVNPWWGVRHLPAEQASQIPGVLSKTSLLMPLAFYRNAWRGGRIKEEDLSAAIEELGSYLQVEQLFLALDKDEADVSQATPLMLSQISSAGGVPAIQTIREQVARACGLFFDQCQSQDFFRDTSHSLFESWLEQSIHDVTLDHKVGIERTRKTLKSISKNHLQAYEWAYKTLALSGSDIDQLAFRLMFELVGWASWCRGVDWREGLEGRASSMAGELLAVLLVWEAIAVEGASTDQRHKWQRAWSRFRSRALVTGSGESLDDAAWVWHRAFEYGYKRQLAESLFHSARGSESAARNSKPAAIQAVFCIDVRSELIRRHLEECSANIETIGFAGFFGMPIMHQTLAPRDSEVRLPGLLAPAYRLLDSTGSPAQDLRLRRAADSRETIRQSVRRAKYTSFSSFTLVESTGLAWAWKLLRDSLNQTEKKEPSYRPTNRRLYHRHGGDPVSDSERVNLAEKMLRGMSKTKDFPSLLVFVGHGSQSDNNPHRSSLACGACGGQNGGVNASAAAELINDPVIRAGLVGRGIRIPDFTIAVAAEHCTVTDRVTILQRDWIPNAYLDPVVQLEQRFEEAGRRTRRERATALGLNGLDDEALLDAMVKRTSSWSEIRPEWGLANNAAIIFAKRSCTRGIDLQGRVFLHDYDPALDDDGTVLEALMTAPMIVANWINLQYLGSVSAPDTFGAGNKLLHSVVGGNLGVVEGNNPDLRLGLSLQSVHDGKKWRHEPIRLHVVIDAPAERIERVLKQQADVRQLVENRWLWLFRWGDGGLEHYRNGNWKVS
ncbi:YbcC family protein [Marinobacter sediminum]|uniref:YbcC family protein n=1 Tax=Marinobacter sediminum TaxID=256323 RepID=UPI003569F38A